MYLDLQPFINALPSYQKGRFALASFVKNNEGNEVKEYCCLGVICERENYPLVRVDNKLAWDTVYVDNLRTYNVIMLPPALRIKYAFDEPIGKYPELAQAFEVMYSMRYRGDVPIEHALMRINDTSADWVLVQTFLTKLNNERQYLNAVEVYINSLKEEAQANAETNNDQGSSGFRQVYVGKRESLPV